MSSTTKKINVGLVMGKYDVKYSISTAKVRINKQRNKKKTVFLIQIPKTMLQKTIGVCFFFRTFVGEISQTIKQMR